jgi:hypothetical protein
VDNEASTAFYRPLSFRILIQKNINIFAWSELLIIFCYKEYGTCIRISVGVGILVVLIFI